LQKPIASSAAGEELHIFLFKSKKSKKRSFGLQPQDDTERQAQESWNSLIQHIEKSCYLSYIINNTIK
jgi:organic hydroperoxide reductase OsmC/OhrA